MKAAKRIYFKVTGGKALEILTKFNDKRETVIKSYGDFCEKYEVENYVSGDGLVGLIFPEEAPEGWILVKGHHANCYRPHSRKKACKHARKIFDNLKRLPGGFELSHDLTNQGSPEYFTGFSINLPSYETISDTVILSVPAGSLEKDNPWQPPEGCEQLKMSEYWQFREETEENVGI